MQSDAVHPLVRLTDWKRRVQGLRTSSVRLQTTRDSLVRDHKTATDEVESLSLDLERLTKTGELLRALMDKLVMDQVTAIESVVTDGLKTIFFDQDLSFKAEVGQSRGKIAIDLLIRRMRGDIEIVGPPLESTGGGISSIASLILRLLSLMRLKKYPLLLLDETLSSVSADYVELTGQFLSKLCQTTGIPTLLVTHNPAFLEHANVAYQGYEEQSDTDLTFKVRKMKGQHENVG